MLSELQFEFGSFYVLVLGIIIAGLSLYFYYELKNIKNIIKEIDEYIKENNSKDEIESNIPLNIPLNTQSNNMLNTIEKDIELNSIKEISSENPDTTGITDLKENNSIDQILKQTEQLERNDEESEQSSDSEDSSNELEDEELIKIINSSDNDDDTSHDEDEEGNDDDDVETIKIENLNSENLITDQSFMEELGNLTDENMLSDNINDILQDNNLDDLSSNMDNTDDIGILNSVDYENYSVKELKDIIYKINEEQNKKIPISGNKTTLIERIVQNL